MRNLIRAQATYKRDIRIDDFINTSTDSDSIKIEFIRRVADYSFCSINRTHKFCENVAFYRSCIFVFKSHTKTNVRRYNENNKKYFTSTRQILNMIKCKTFLSSLSAICNRSVNPTFIICINNLLVSKIISFVTSTRTVVHFISYI